MAVRIPSKLKQLKLPKDKKIDPLKFFRNFLKRKKYTVCWNDRIFIVNVANREVFSFEKGAVGRRVNYCIAELSSLTQDFYEIPLLESDKKNLRKYVETYLSSMEYVSFEDSYIFPFISVFDASVEKNSVVSIVKVDKNEVSEFLNDCNCYYLIPIEFLLAAHTKTLINNDYAMCFYFEEQNKAIVLFVEKGVPTEIIRDTVFDWEDFIKRSVGYFESKLKDKFLRLSPSVVVIGRNVEYLKDALERSFNLEVFFDSPDNLLYSIPEVDPKNQVKRKAVYFILAGKLALLGVCGYVYLGVVKNAYHDFLVSRSLYKHLTVDLRREKESFRRLYGLFLSEKKTYAKRDKYVKKIAPFSSLPSLPAQVTGFVNPLIKDLGLVTSKNIVFNEFTLTKQGKSYILKIQGKVLADTSKSMNVNVAKLRSIVGKYSNRLKLIIDKPAVPPVAKFEIRGSVR